MTERSQIAATRGAWRLGYTTGTCAAAAAKAATLALLSDAIPVEVDVGLPNGERAKLPVYDVSRSDSRGFAAVRKDAGDDPDITDQMAVCVEVSFADGTAVTFSAGSGIGTVTLPGLALPPGEPAINPAPRRQIVAAVREVTHRGLVVTVSIPGGERLASRTFNPRLGIVGGLSILGTDGRVRPFSHERLVSALLLSVDVAAANGVVEPVLVPGHIGRRHALASLGCAEAQIIEVSNAVGATLEHCRKCGMKRVLLLGHPGKFAKLIGGEFDTHSSRSRSATESVRSIGQQLGLFMADGLPTTEAIFSSLAVLERQKLGACVATAIRDAAETRFAGLSVAVWLTDLAGDRLGTAGELSPWHC